VQGPGYWAPGISLLLCGGQKTQILSFISEREKVFQKKEKKKERT